MRILRWDQELPFSESLDLIRGLVPVFHSRISPSPEVWPFLEACERFVGGTGTEGLLTICQFEIDYASVTLSNAIAIRQIQAFFQKMEGLVLRGHDRRRAAVLSFIESERLCRETNEVLVARRRGDFSFSMPVEAVLHGTQRKISSMLPAPPTLAELKLRFGPGATTQVVKRTASARRKLGEAFACSEDLLPVVKDVLEEVPSWLPEGNEDRVSVPVCIHTGKLSFVPKSYKTDRTVVVEPMLNGFVQMGVGDFLVSVLKRAGLDLRDQTPNQRLAREGSLTDALATLDLSSASDTIAFELIPELLPVDWYLFLAPFRTGIVDCEGVNVRLQKFSSMGNGFTFPLESLLFYALAYSATAYVGGDLSKVRVYGDDIVVPSQAYGVLSDTLRAIGFKPNASKSFASGPFRESCGRDYLSGIDIRPVYIKRALIGCDVFRLHNFFYRSGDHIAADHVLQWIDESVRKYGPDGYGDGHLLGGSAVPFRRDRGWGGYVFETFTWKPRRDFRVSPGDRVYPAYCSYVGTSREATHPVLKDGRFGVSTPGRQGVNLIKIYTLNPS